MRELFLWIVGQTIQQLEKRIIAKSVARYLSIVFYNSLSILDFSTAITWSARRLPCGCRVRDPRHSHSKSKWMNQDEMLDGLSYNVLSKGPGQPLWLVLGEPINTASKQLLGEHTPNSIPMDKPMNSPLDWTHGAIPRSMDEGPCGVSIHQLCGIQPSAAGKLRARNLSQLRFSSGDALGG